MKLARYGVHGEERPAVLDSDGTLRDLSGHIPDIGPETLAPVSLAELAALDTNSLPVVPSFHRLGPPVSNIGKLVCIGLNYRLHAQEAGLAIPEEPIIFMKATTSLCGPNDNVMLPRDSVKSDWEVELTAVIGTRASYVEEADALDHVAGYCIANDVSERAFQIEGTGQWVKGKSADTFCPVGPYLVTRDEITDPQQLGLWLEVDSKRYQDGSTDDMIFSVSHLVSYVSRYMTLMPGDLLLTGTPSGVGFGLKPPVYLRAGNTMRLGIEGLGEQVQNVVAFEQN
ncbi:MAG: fumarylacetoacetate hydrolase family protein [Acidiferrobacterales bacterium]|nr:fumarylacetoacetate hydrolase family protein [Acidiferrobacterales bacterium]